MDKLNFNELKEKITVLFKESLASIYGGGCISNPYKADLSDYSLAAFKFDEANEDVRSNVDFGGRP